MFSWIEKHRSWLLPTTLILFILEIATLPFVIEFTYAGRSEKPSHTLVYTADHEGAALQWDSDTGVRSDGSAELDLFFAEYDGVKSEDGEDVIAPGTDGFNIVRLENHVSGETDYTAVLYRIDSSDKIPVKASLSGENFSDTADFPLPGGVKEDQVIRAVKGTLNGGQLQDFDINWHWTYYDDDVQDIVDTYLGNKFAFGNPDRVRVGLYIVVEDEGTYVSPKPPQTGDDFMLGLHITLICISGALLVLLPISRRREEKCKD